MPNDNSPRNPGAHPVEQREPAEGSELGAAASPGPNGANGAETETELSGVETEPNGVDDRADPAPAGPDPDTVPSPDPDLVPSPDAEPGPDADNVFPVEPVAADAAATDHDVEPLVVGPSAPPAPPDWDQVLRIVVDAVVVAACALFVFLQLGPSNLLSDSTPAGGDMGAHVWGPAYLRDVLLPNFQITGWAPDWYAGFPAYQFYMVVPSLLIVLLDVGIEGPLAAVPLAVGVGLLAYGALSWPDRRRRNLALGTGVGALLLVGLPYGVAFKLVSVSGVVLMPVAAYLFGRLSGLRFPAPAVLAAATLPFLFYRGFTIYGGNLASTLAGEFAFSMSLSLALVYLGVVFRGLETGRHRGWAAGLLALTGLCHLIPAFWVLGATFVIIVVRFRRSNAPLLPCVGLGASGAVAGLFGAGILFLGTSWAGPLDGVLRGLAILLVGAAVVLAALGLWLASQSARWILPVLVVGGLLAAFWVMPFVLRRDYVNDMGWEKVPYDAEIDCPVGEDAEGDTGPCEYLLPRDTVASDLRWAFALAVLGAGMSLALRLRPGIFLLLSIVATGVAFVVLPEGRLWNARLLPFYYLSIILLAGLAVVETVRLVAQLAQPRREPSTALGAGTALGALAVTLLFVGLPLGVVPWDEARTGGGYAWPSFSPFWKFEANHPAEVNVKGWANWNYTGYEGKASYREYYDLVQTMDRLGQQRGCGRSLWEYEKELDRFGTPMALMLLPYWTDGCIGSMEGLYFEASATTPYHFLMQVELSENPSAAQRDMPYAGFDITRGVQHLQLMGVRYYMATSPLAIQAANTHPDLTEVARSGPWVVYEVADSELVTPLAYEPAVLEGIDPGQEDWLEEPRGADPDPEDENPGPFGGPSVSWFQDPQSWDVLLAAGGPDSWPRIEVGERPERNPVTEVEVTNIVADPDHPDRISFDVDQVGSPVLMKASYFPNWQVDGARGPWRVAPNLMVVVPTERHVELSYGRTPVEWFGYGLTLVGLVGLVVLARRGAYRFRDKPSAPPPSSLPSSLLPPPAGALAVPFTTSWGDRRGDDPDG